MLIIIFRVTEISGTNYLPHQIALINRLYVLHVYIFSHVSVTLIYPHDFFRQESRFARLKARVKTERTIYNWHVLHTSHRHLIPHTRTRTTCSQSTSFVNNGEILFFLSFLLYFLSLIGSHKRPIVGHETRRRTLAITTLLYRRYCILFFYFFVYSLKYTSTCSWYSDQR